MKYHFKIPDYVKGRSPAYQLGFSRVYHFRNSGSVRGTMPDCPYLQGSSDFDAYFAGNKDGHSAWRAEYEEYRIS